jgi:hypothetical protein
MASGMTARLATLVIFLVVFGAGLAVGVAVDRKVASAADAPVPSVVGEGESREAAGDEEEGEEDPPRERRMLIERVGLTPDQKLQVDSIVAVMGGRMSDLQKDYRRQYWAVVDSSRASLKQILTMEQAVMYDSLLAESDRRRDRNAVRLPRN